MSGLEQVTSGQYLTFLERALPRIHVAAVLALCVTMGPIQSLAWGQYSDQKLEHWLQRFPDSDTNRDGRLTSEEADVFRKSMRRGSAAAKTGAAKSTVKRGKAGAPREFPVDPGWNADRFPDQAVCYRTPEEIAKLYPDFVSVPETVDGSLRIVGTGHSFMTPGYGTLPKIAKAAGFNQQTLLVHTGGGITGSARYKWEQENGIFEFAGRPKPKLLSSIANGQWDVMMWGPYFNDRTDYYRCWIDFCLKFNPEMKFYLSDAWPQLYQLEEIPKSEEQLSFDVISRMGVERHATFASVIKELNKDYPGKVFVLPTSDAMVLAAKAYHRDELPGVEGIHKLIGGKERSLWRDQLGHLGPGFERLEGYVFYATLYGRSPEFIDGDLRFGGSPNYPSEKLDRAFRRIAWQSVVNNALSGVLDTNENGIDDNRE